MDTKKAPRRELLKDISFAEGLRQQKEEEQHNKYTGYYLRRGTPGTLRFIDSSSDQHNKTQCDCKC